MSESSIRALSGRDKDMLDAMTFLDFREPPRDDATPARIAEKFDLLQLPADCSAQSEGTGVII